MEALKTRSENSFKNKVIMLLIIGIVAVNLYWMYLYSEARNNYSDSAYFISPDMTYLGTMQHDYHMSAVEIRAMTRLFYSTMFTFSADSYHNNLKYAKENLVDYETGVYIESRFTQADMFNQLLRSNGSLLTVLDSIGPVDLRKEPVRVIAYCHQSVVVGEEKSNVPFINEFDVYYEGIPRTDENPFGIQIRNWRNKTTD